MSVALFAGPSGSVPEGLHVINRWARDSPRLRLRYDRPYFGAGYFYASICNVHRYAFVLAKK